MTKIKPKAQIFIDGANMFFAQKSNIHDLRTKIRLTGLVLRRVLTTYFMKCVSRDIIIEPCQGWHLGLASCNFAGVTGQTPTDQLSWGKANQCVDAVIGFIAQLCQKSSSEQCFASPLGAFCMGRV